jgi:hypothetical protein
VRDPHVQAIHYNISSGEGVSYVDPEPMSFSNHLGTFDLSDGKLRIVPSEHFPDERSACRAIEPFLEEWKIYVHLLRKVEMLRFEFDRVELIDRAPPPLPGQARVFNPSIAEFAMAGSSASCNLTCRKYPEPPAAFHATTEVQHAYRRWLEYRSGKEPLQSMAYFVLTRLETVTSAKKERRMCAARLFQIDTKVLDKIGELSSERGDERTARKAPNPGEQFRELRGAEKQWLEEAIPRVILRLGEQALGISLAPISLGDLPRL